MKIVARCSGISEARRLQRSLQMASIDAFIHEETQSSLRLAGLPVRVHVSVEDDQVERAVRHIAGEHPELVAIREEVLCPECERRFGNGQVPQKSIGVLKVFWVLALVRFAGRCYCPGCGRTWCRRGECQFSDEHGD